MNTTKAYDRGVDGTNFLTQVVGSIAAMLWLSWADEYTESGAGEDCFHPEKHSDTIPKLSRWLYVDTGNGIRANTPWAGVFGEMYGSTGGTCLRYVRSGKVVIGSRDPDKAKEAALKLQEKAPPGSVRGEGNQEAARQGDIVFLTVPYDALQSLLPQLVDELAGENSGQRRRPVGL